MISMGSISLFDDKLWWFPGLLLLLPVVATADEAAEKYFDQQVAPLLARRCLECHN